jgi:prepilin-type N-terminal cleavage/methylation domain-containing protein/prepilin-type processing-associated H-X9-DG protein
MNKKGFTLIELLVVIAIIAILLSVLTPSLNKAKNQARAVVCSSNLGQVGLAINLYAEANNGWIPRGADSNVATRTLWFTAILPYLGHNETPKDYRQVKILRCPSFPMTGEGMNSIPNERQTVTYVVNAWGRNDQEINKCTKILNARNASGKIYLADNEAGSWRPIVETAACPNLDLLDVFYLSHLPTSTVVNNQQGRRVARDRHRKGCNVLFADWHSSWMAADDMTDSMWKGLGND